MQPAFVSRYAAQFTYSDGALQEYLEAHNGQYPPRLLDLPAPLETMPDPAGEYDEVLRDIRDNQIPSLEIIQTHEFMQRISEILSQNAMLGLLQHASDYPKNIPLIDQQHTRPVADFLYETGLKGGRSLLERAKRSAEAEATNEEDETNMDIN